MTRAVTLANLADTNIFTVDGANDRVVLEQHNRTKNYKL